MQKEGGFKLLGFIVLKHNETNQLCDWKKNSMFVNVLSRGYLFVLCKTHPIPNTRFAIDQWLPVSGSDQAILKKQFKIICF